MSIDPIATPRASRRALALASATACALSITSLPPRTARAVEPPSPSATTLDTIQVRGERPPSEVRIGHAREALDRRAGGTTLVRGDDVRAGRAGSISDIMALAPGVLAQTRHGEEARFSIRGSGIQRGFLMRGIQLYQDGIPLNLADGAGDYQSIDPLVLQYVEVWRGANALEYGASALGGAVNFVTPVGGTGPAARVRIDAGSHGQRRAHVLGSGAGDSFDAMASLTHGEQEGWRDHSANRSTRLSANAGWRVDDTLDWRVYLQHVDAAMEMPGSLTGAAMAADPRQTASGNARLDASNDYRLDRVATRLSWTPSADRSLAASAWVSDRARFHPMVYGILEQDSRDTGFDLRSVRDFAGPGAPVRRLVHGASSARYRGEEWRSTNVAGSPGDPTGHQRLDGRMHTLYAEYSHGIDRRLVLQAGVQAARAERRLDNLADPTGSYDLAFDAVNPRLGLLFDLAASGQLIANVSRSFEPPPFGEAPVRPLLPLPDAQRATTWEAGWRRRRGGMHLEAIAYHARIDGELLALTDGTGASIGTANADRTIHQGLELGATVPLGDALRLRGAYLWNDFRFDGDAAYGDNTIAGIAPHVLQAELEWQANDRLAVAPRIEWQPSATWIDHANTVRQRGHALLHLRLHGDAGRNLRWFADVRNLTDRAHVGGTAVQANVRGADGAYYFPGDPRSIHVGLEWAMP